MNREILFRGRSRRFGSLIVESLNHKGKISATFWNMKCDCGKTIVVSYYNLKSGKVKSCGCKRRENIIKRNKKHGMSKTRIYRIWRGLFKRCENKNSTDYSNYGARGIKICSEWKESFLKFQIWAYANGYKDNLTIERINNDGNYEALNCKWVTKGEQNKNQRKKKRLPNRNKKGQFIYDNPELLKGE